MRRGFFARGRGRCPWLARPPSLRSARWTAQRGRGGEGKVGRQAARKAAPSQGSTNALRAGEIGAIPPLGTCLAGVISAAWVQARGCKGRSPLHKKTKNLPLPRRGRGTGGWGRNQSERQGRQVAKKACPRWAPGRLSCFRLARVQPGDARGGAPCIKIT